MKRIILNFLVCILFTIVAIIIIALLVYRQSRMTDFGNVLLYAFVYFWPLSFLVFFIIVHILLHSQWLSSEQKWLQHRRALWYLIPALLILLVVPLDKFINNDLLLIAIFAVVLILSLAIYLRLPWVKSMLGILLLMAFACQQKPVEENESADVQVPEIKNDAPMAGQTLQCDTLVKCDLLGAWGSEEEGAIFIIERDSIDYFEWDPPMKYFYTVDTCFLNVQKPNYPDSSKMDIYPHRIYFVTKDSLTLETAGNIIRYVKVVESKERCL